MLNDFYFIKDFILVYYKRKFITDGLPLIANSYFKNKFLKEDSDIYCNMQFFMLEFMVKQLFNFYPKCNIHIITNCKKEEMPQGTIVHNFALATNHYSKFLIYGLLNVPAMYMDLDILIFSKFKKQYLLNFPFNVYSISSKENLQNMSKKKLPVKVEEIYNTGIVWISQPSKKITDELKNLNEIYFSDHDYLVKKRKWPCVDEYALSLYIKLNNIKINLSDSVNKSRLKISEQLKSYQTIHYAGVKSKKLFFKECSLKKIGPSG